jgi:hypothetical protein
MNGKLFSGNERLVRVVLHRVGTPAEVYRADGTATENAYGKVQDGDRTRNKVTDLLAYRMYRYKDDFPAEARTAGGRVDTDTPFLVFQKEADVQEDDRIIFQDDDKEYHLDEEIPYATHVEYRSTLVTNE